MSRFAAAIIIVCAATPLPAQDSLPERAFLVDGGAVAVTAFVQGDPSRPLLPGKMPTLYVARLRNETENPIWVDCEMKVKEKKDFEKIESGRIDPGQGSRFIVPSFGVIEEAPVPIRFTVYSDKSRTGVIGREETSMFFEKDDVKAFKKMARLGRLGLILGWREMKNKFEKVETSRADEDLQADIQRALWKEESKTHRDCAHVATGVAEIPRDESVLSRLTGEAHAKARDLLDAEQLWMEEWSMRSCDAVRAYEVLMARSPVGGTDLAAVARDDVDVSMRTAARFVEIASLGAEAMALEGAARLENYKGQFSIELPAGWHARDQDPGSLSGVIVFAAEDPSRIPIDEKKNVKKQVLAIQERIDSGESPRFFVDRRPSDEGASCEGFSPAARDRLLGFYKEMPGLGEDTRIVEGPAATEASIGGCNGLAVTIKARTKKKDDLVMLIRAVSDGTTHYDFAVRAHQEFLEGNKQAFESALETLRLTGAR